MGGREGGKEGRVGEKGREGREGGRKGRREGREAPGWRKEEGRKGNLIRYNRHKKEMEYILLTCTYIYANVGNMKLCAYESHMHTDIKYTHANTHTHTHYNINHYRT